MTNEPSEAASIQMPQSDDVNIENLRLTGNIDVSIKAGRRFVNIDISEAFVGVSLSFYPDEAEHIVRGLLKAIEHVKRLTP